MTHKRDWVLSCLDGSSISGSRGEMAEAARLAQQIKNSRCISLAWQTTLAELLGLYAIARLLVTNDSGPAHFASLIRLPTIALFGPETPRLYGPLGNYGRCLSASLACSPCLSVYNHKRSSCKDNVCMQTISPERVFQEALQMLVR